MIFVAEEECKGIVIDTPLIAATAAVMISSIPVVHLVPGRRMRRSIPESALTLPSHRIPSVAATPHGPRTIVTVGLGRQIIVPAPHEGHGPPIMTATAGRHSPRGSLPRIDDPSPRSQIGVEIWWRGVVVAGSVIQGPTPDSLIMIAEVRYNFFYININRGDISVICERGRGWGCKKLISCVCQHVLHIHITDAGMLL